MLFHTAEYVVVVLLCSAGGKIDLDAHSEGSLAGFPLNLFGDLLTDAERAGALVAAARAGLPEI